MSRICNFVQAHKGKTFVREGQNASTSSLSCTQNESGWTSVIPKQLYKTTRRNLEQADKGSMSVILLQYKIDTRSNKEHAPSAANSVILGVVAMVTSFSNAQKDNGARSEIPMFHSFKVSRFGNPLTASILVTHGTELKQIVVILPAMLFGTSGKGMETCTGAWAWP